jgi:hypothetical protein
LLNKRSCAIHWHFVFDNLCHHPARPLTIHDRHPRTSQRLKTVTRDDAVIKNEICHVTFVKDIKPMAYESAMFTTQKGTI